MANEMFTQLPTVSNATLSDIICAVQGYVSPSSPGTSVQETLQQVLNLMLSNTILSNPGDPNGVVAGSTYQLLWDTTDNILWVCTTTGTASTAVWKVCTSSVNGITWTDVTGTTQNISSNTGYITNNASGVTYTLPVSSIVGSIVYIVGRQSGWTIAQNASQQIIVGHSSSTAGTGGSIASTNAHDCITLVCTLANLEWTAISVQGIITVT